MELERVLVTEKPVSNLRGLADPYDLHLLFCLELCAIVRWGAGGPTDPGRLLSVAQQAAQAGTIPVATPVALRNTLKQLETRLHRASAWEPARPLWWTPLPEPNSLEQLWEGLQNQSHSFSPVLSQSDLSTAFADPPDAHPWLTVPSLLAAHLTRTLHEELESAYGAGRLQLERGSVGPDGSDSPSRADLVGYFSGMEQGLLETLPTVAVVVQWLLHAFRTILQTAISTSDLFAPQSAMIARYPAPSSGYRPHIDNPSPQHQNGRCFTLVAYLNGPEQECVGGDLALWAPGRRTSDPPTAVFPARSGSAVLFASRTIPHQVRPLQLGPARWALTLWFHDAPARARILAAPPELTIRDALLPVENPPLPPDVILFHELHESDPAGELVVRSGRRNNPRVGLVSTVYVGGLFLDAWCEHHVDLGFDHLVLIFDRLEEPQEAADAERLAAKYPATLVTVWSGAEVAANRWPRICEDPDARELLRFAHAGSSAHAVAARQTLNASAALRAAKGVELGGAPLDWLLHLDGDELFYLQGNGRGGETLHRHFAAVFGAKLQLLRYVNHELLLPNPLGRQPCFKLNPRLAAARFGRLGWSRIAKDLRMTQSDPRPYFNSYYNGKSAVFVPAGRAAAGVHSWSLSTGRGATHTRFLAGPAILHLHGSSREAFRRKYLAKAKSPIPSGPLLFEPSPMEVAALDLILSLERAGADKRMIEKCLDELYDKLTSFTESERKILDEAGLIIRPQLRWPVSASGSQAPVVSKLDGCATDQA